ncbi:MAG: squalene/phytoene synthase family protein, partial [Phycisphaerales bacterium]|nr:squalene/phytoene synthase family protein [Phycisphaerales bacterium]
MAALPASSGPIADSYEHCRAVVRERARNFYYGLRLTPDPKRSAIYAIYAWSRAADDGADDAAPVATRRERLAR